MSEDNQVVIPQPQAEPVAPAQPGTPTPTPVQTVPDPGPSAAEPPQPAAPVKIAGVWESEDDLKRDMLDLLGKAQERDQLLEVMKAVNADPGGAAYLQAKFGTPQPQTPQQVMQAKQNEAADALARGDVNSFTKLQRELFEMNQAAMQQMVQQQVQNGISQAIQLAQRPAQFKQQFLSDQRFKDIHAYADQFVNMVNNGMEPIAAIENIRSMAAMHKPQIPQGSGRRGDLFMESGDGGPTSHIKNMSDKDFTSAITDYFKKRQ